MKIYHHDRGHGGRSIGRRRISDLFANAADADEEIFDDRAQVCCGQLLLRSGWSRAETLRPGSAWLPCQMLSAWHPARAPCQTCTSQEQGARHARAHGSGSNIVLLMRRTITHGLMAWSLCMALGFFQRRHSKIKAQFDYRIVPPTHDADRRHTCTTASVFAHFRQVFANFPQCGFFDRCLLRYCKHGVSSRTGNTRIT